MEDCEVHFWRLQRDRLGIIKAVRAHRERAMSFFGVASTLSENEGELLRTLEARSIVNSSDDEILAEMNAVFAPLGDALEEITPAAHLELVRGALRFTTVDVLKVKDQARKHLARVCPESK